MIAIRKSPVSARSRIAAALAMALACSGSTWAAEFVYQGQLDDRGAPANGRYDLRIAAFGDETSAAGLMAPLTFADVDVRNGRFELRFDAALAKDREAWLEVAVRAAGTGGFSAIPGRSKAIAAALIGACWSSTGDAGTTASNFLGTTDAQALVLRTGNVQSLRIEPSTVTDGGGPITANVVAGSRTNFLQPGVRGATIAGGGVPMGDSDPDFYNDYPNFVGDHYGTVGGGFGNRAGDFTGTVADRAFATVAGGYVNGAYGYASAVGGGELNSASGMGAAIGGGGGNTASHMHSMVPGGYSNCAGGIRSFAAGTYAKVRVGSASDYSGFGCNGVAPSGDVDGDEGSFVWADAQLANFVSTGNNQFLVRAAGGIWLGTTSAPSIPVGSFLHTSTGAYLSTAGVWTDSSSRTLKTDFSPVDAEGVLDRVLALPISEWSYLAAPTVRHVGPVAEDFHASFGLGESERHIASLDSAGVALAAIQGLNARLEAENAAKAAEIATLRDELAALRALVERRIAAEH